MNHSLQITLPCQTSLTACPAHQDDEKPDVGGGRKVMVQADSTTSPGPSGEVLVIQYLSTWEPLKNLERRG